MAKKKGKKIVKVKKTAKIKKAAKTKKPVAKKAAKRKKPIIKKVKGPKAIGKVEHYFGHISVAALKLKAPLSVGDIIRIKGHTTDFVQTISSMQINHQEVPKASKGQDVGFKVKDKVRQGDYVYPATKEELTAVLQPKVAQVPSFPPMAPKPQLQKPAPTPPPPAQQNASGYSDTKFMKF